MYLSKLALSRDLLLRIEAGERVVMEIRIEKVKLFDEKIVKVFFNGKQNPIFEKYPITEKEFNKFTDFLQGRLK